MSTPITWRNVTGPSLADAAKPLAYAQSAFSGGFDALNTALKGFQSDQEKIWKQEDAQATQDVLSKIYGADTLDKFNALRANGVLDQAIAANGARIDRAAVNALLDGRVGTLQTRDKDNAAYALDLKTREQSPIFRQIQALAISDPPAAQKLLNENPGLVKEFELAKLIDEQAQLLKERTYKANDETFKEQERPVKLQQLRSSIAANQRQAEVSAFQLQTSKEDRQRKIDEARVASEMQNNPYRNGPLNAANAALLVKEMKDLNVAGGEWGTQEKQQALMQRIVEAANKGVDVSVVDPATGKVKTVNMPIPFDVARASILGAQNEGLFKWNSGYADSFDTNLETALKGLKTLATRTGQNGTQVVADSPLAASYQKYLQMQNYGLAPKAIGQGSNNAASTSSGTGKRK